MALLGTRLIAVVALLAVACSFRHLPNPLSREISVEDEVELGAQVNEQIRLQAPMITDPILLAYVNDLGQSLVRVTEPQPFIYRFNIIKDDSLNAFAVPGGYIYLHSGVIAQAGNVSELAGVLAHEVAHVRKRHIARAQEKSGATSMATMAAVIVGMAAGGEAGQALAAVASGINVSLQLKHTREHEAEADYEGMGYMIDAGYDPDGMTRFFERIQASSRGYDGIPPYLFSHPAVKDRIVANRGRVEHLAEEGELPYDLVAEDERLPEMQDRLAMLMQPVAGGTGLQARASFDRTVTDPLLERAHAFQEQGRVEEAQLALDEAAALEPNDPRVAMRQAELAQERGDLSAAVDYMTRAFEIDPQVPLVQYQLGVLHKRLGDRTRAVFYLEQAAANFAPGSSGRKRAEFQVATLSWPVLDDSGLSSEADYDKQLHFQIGDDVVWWGRVSRHFVTRNPVFDIRWIDPSGAVAQHDRARMGPTYRVSSSLADENARPGLWTVEVTSEDTRVDERSFELLDSAHGA